MKRIALLINETRDLNTYPPVIETAKLLSDNGWFVDIYIPEQMKTEWRYKNVQVIVTSDSTKYHYIKNTISSIKRSGIAYEWFMAYFIEGLVIADIINQETTYPVKTIYFSLELFYLDFEKKLKKQFPIYGSFLLKPFSVLFKIAENMVPIWISFIHRPLDNLCYLFELSNSYKNINIPNHPWVKFSIIQDEFRAKFLKREFKFAKDILLVPNSYIGFNANKSDFAYKKFKIDKNKKIILYTGGIEKGFDLEFIEITRKLPQDYVLLLQGFSRDKYAKELKNIYSELIAQNRLVVSDENLNEVEHNNLIQSSYICIAWYPKISETNFNMYYLGWASGKLTKYLAFGKPVITPKYIFGYKELIDDQSLGISVSDSSELIKAIETINKKYNHHLKSILSFYNKKLEYSKGFKKVINQLNNEIH